MNNDNKIVMISISYYRENKNLINSNIKEHKDISDIITRASIVSNEFTHTHEDNIDIYQILTDLKFSITCYPNEILQFHFFKYQNSLDFMDVRNNTYLHLCRGDALGNNINTLCHFTLSYDTLMENYKRIRYGWMVPQFTYDKFKCNHYDEILKVLQQTILPTELCLIILDYLQKIINFSINCHYSNTFNSNTIYSYHCNPCIVIK